MQIPRAKGQTGASAKEIQATFATYPEAWDNAGSFIHWATRDSCVHLCLVEHPLVFACCVNSAFVRMGGNHHCCFTEKDNSDADFLGMSDLILFPLALLPLYLEWYLSL